MNPHFLQTEAWEEFQKSEGRETFRVKGSDFEFMAILRPTSLGNYLFVPYGPVLKSKKALPHALDALKKLAADKKAFFIRIEPTLEFSEAEMAKLKLKKTHHIEPQHTWVLDLTQSEDDILAGMESRKVRYYRNYTKKGMSIRTTHDPKEMKILFKLLSEVAETDNFQTFDEKYLENQLKFPFATLYIVEVTEEDKKDPIPIAAALMYDTDDTCYYAHTGAEYEHRKLNAGIILLIKMILDAKKNGRKKFDFWGVTTSEDPKHPWYGFTKFKQAFGGQLVTYTGTYDLPLNSAKYRAYSLLRPLNKLKRKLTHH